MRIYIFFPITESA